MFSQLVESCPSFDSLTNDSLFFAMPSASYRLIHFAQNPWHYFLWVPLSLVSCYLFIEKGTPLLMNTASALFQTLGMKLGKNFTREHQASPKEMLNRKQLIYIRFIFMLDYHFIFLSLWNPYPFEYLKPENGTPFRWSLPL